MQGWIRKVFRRSKELITIDFFVSPAFTWIVGILGVCNLLGILILGYREFRDR